MNRSAARLVKRVPIPGISEDGILGRGDVWKGSLQIPCMPLVVIRDIYERSWCANLANHIYKLLDGAR